MVAVTNLERGVSTALYELSNPMLVLQSSRLPCASTGRGEHMSQINWQYLVIQRTIVPGLLVESALKHSRFSHRGRLPFV